MPIPKAETSAISFHLSGQAIAKFDGVTFNLGPFGSPRIIRSLRSSSKGLSSQRA